MAIKIHDFETWQTAITNQTQENLSAYRNELLAWLEENAAEFFDSMTLSGETITLSKGDAYIALRVDAGSSNVYTCQKLKNGLISTTNTNNNRQLYRSAVKTSTGIYLCQYYSASACYADIIITKTKSGHTCFVWARTTNTLDSNNSLRHGVSCVDLEGSIKTYCFGGNATSSVNTPTWIGHQSQWGADASVLSPLVFSGGETTENAYVMPFTQAASLEHKKVSIDGTEYFTNGYMVLRG